MSGDNLNPFNQDMLERVVLAACMRRNIPFTSERGKAVRDEALRLYNDGVVTEAYLLDRLILAH